MTAPEIARRRMRNSRLTGTPFSSPEETVRWHGGMQAQDYGPAKWSIAQRSKNVSDADIDDAVSRGSIIRTHVLRETWHFVARDDLRWLLALTGPRLQRSNASRYRQLGLDARTRARCESRISTAIEEQGHLTRDQIGGVLDAARIDRAGQRLPHILMHCELEGAICSGGRAGKHHTYALVDERVPRTPRFDRDNALTELVRRYLASHGPATIKDLQWWASLTAADIRHGLEALGSQVKSETIEGTTLWSVKGAGRLPAAGGAHLLQTYDELIVGYTESRFFGDPVGTKARTAWRDRRLPTGTVLLDGRVAGHWKRTIDKHHVEVEILTYRKPAPDDFDALE